MAKTFVIGDIHGAHLPLKQCLERSGFNKESDLLITLGDICDGWPYVYECVEELLTIENRIDIIGNHDAWFKTFLDTGIHTDHWRQGGKGTKVSYLRAGNLLNELDQDRWLLPEDVPLTHWRFFHQQNLYYKDSRNRLFIHGGFDRQITLTEQKAYNPENFYWDRELWNEAMSTKNGQKLKIKEVCSEIYIGHTQTTYWTKQEKLVSRLIIPGGEPVMSPMKADIIYNLDTGAGSNGKLTIMDIETKKYWQSDPVNKIYGEYKPRG